MPEKKSVIPNKDYVSFFENEAIVIRPQQYVLTTNAIRNFVKFIFRKNSLLIILVQTFSIIKRFKLILSLKTS